MELTDDLIRNIDHGSNDGHDGGHVHAYRDPDDHSIATSEPHRQGLSDSLWALSCGHCTCSVEFF